MSTDSRFVHQIWQEQELSRMVDGGVPFPDAVRRRWEDRCRLRRLRRAAGWTSAAASSSTRSFIVRAMEVLTPEVGRNPESWCGRSSGWNPGDTTLTPGPELVGKVWTKWKP
jgi:hypothetical protein